MRREKKPRVIKVTLSLTTLTLIFCGYFFYRECAILRELYVTLLSFRWMMMLMAFVCVLLGGLILSEFSMADLPLIGLVLIAAVFPLLANDHRIGFDAIILVFGATLGRAVRYLFRHKTARRKRIWAEKVQMTSQSISKSPIALFNLSGDTNNFLVGLSVLLAIASCSQLHLPNAFYNGPRWMGIWDNPNEYGMLMGTGIVLAAGLLTMRKDLKSKGLSWLSPTLFIAIGMMVVGLLFSYSRGAWLATAIGLTYLANRYGKLNWRHILLGLMGIAAVVWIFWNSTPESAPWYLKRMDFGRSSAQHRVAAWKAGVEIMRDHPFGVGWENAIEVYVTDYSPPQGGAGAIATNDYLMLGTQLGLPGLLCFLAYVALCFKCPTFGTTGAEPESHWKIRQSNSVASSNGGVSALDAPQIACRAAAISMLVAFWFDDGLFQLATASVFWILLELGRARRDPTKGYFQPAFQGLHSQVKLTT